MKTNIFNIGLFTLILFFLASCSDDDHNAVAEIPPTQQFEAGLNTINFESEGETLVGGLFLPETYEEGQQLPVIIVSGPWTQVKEQVGYRYGEILAEQGYAALAFDHRFWGESGGEPRNLESTNEKSLDILNAVDFLVDLNAIDENRIAVLGVCAGVGNVSLAAAADTRIQAMATISPWIQHPETTPLFYGGAEGVAARIALAEEAERQYAETGVMPYVPAYDPNDPEAAMFFPVDYYANTERGNIEEWENRFAVQGWSEWLELNSVDFASNVTVPVRIIYGEETFLPQNITAFFDLLPNQNKDIFLISGEHTQFYDLDPFVTETARSAVEHFDLNL